MAVSSTHLRLRLERGFPFRPQSAEAIAELLKMLCDRAIPFQEIDPSAYKALGAAVEGSR